VVGAQGAGAVFEVLLEERDGLGEPARVLVRVGEVVARVECVGMAEAQNADGVCEVLLVQFDGLVELSGCLVGACNIDTCNEGVGVVGAQGVELCVES
jgi:hypothetical protein